MAKFEGRIGEGSSARFYLGKTQKEVREGQRKDLEQFLSGEWHPYMRKHRHFVLLVWRDLFGWNTTVQDLAPGDTYDGNRSYCSCQGYSREDAIGDGLYHLAQIAHMPGAPIPEWLPTKTRGSLASWIDFQDRYRAARAAGLSDDAAHSYAGRNPSRMDLWKDTIYPIPAAA